ncbi:MAG: sulfotransferase [Deltaproteobacteria bacterium]|nr:sulfotransferase [Deltaproteobacteria bacterium]
MKTPLFSCGFGSGGSDLTKNILNAHPDIYIASEINRLIYISKRGYDCNTVFSELAEVDKFQRFLRDLHGGHVFESIDYDFSNEMEQKGILGIEYVVQRCLSNREKDVSVWGAKTDPEQIVLLSKLFPRAKFLLVTRDVRDVCLSWRNKWGKDMVWCAAKWADRMAQGLKFASAMGTAGCLVVTFEDLISETEKSCHNICNFIGVPFSDRMLNYHVYTDRWEKKLNYGRPIISTNKEKWRKKLTKKMIIRIEEIAYSTMKLSGYQPEFANELKPISRYEKVRGVCLDSWAILFVGNRAYKKNCFRLRIRNAFRMLRKVCIRHTQLPR